MAVNHYENFPVASILIPKKQRFAIQSIYYFARTADDIADENLHVNIKVKQRQLKAFKQHLDNIKNNITNANFENENIKKIFENLAEIIPKFNLNIQYFYDLLIAFQQDLVKHKYNNFSELKKYCSYSANPVGRLVLTLFDINDKQAFYHSDCICSALQLINFCQDFFIDLTQKQRLYIPLNEIKKYNLTYDYFLQTAPPEILCNNSWKKLMLFQCNRAKNLMLQGIPLLTKLSGRLKWEIKFTISGGLFIIEKIINSLETNDNLSVENYRPLISKKDFFVIFKKSLFL